MFAIVAVIIFALCAFGITALGAVQLLPLGLLFLALAVAFPIAFPTFRRA